METDTTTVLHGSTSAETESTPSETTVESTTMETDTTTVLPGSTSAETESTPSETTVASTTMGTDTSATLSESTSAETESTREETSVGLTTMETDTTTAPYSQSTSAESETTPSETTVQLTTMETDSPSAPSASTSSQAETTPLETTFDSSTISNTFSTEPTPIGFQTTVESTIVTTNTTNNWTMVSWSTETQSLTTEGDLITTQDFEMNSSSSSANWTTNLQTSESHSEETSVLQMNATTELVTDFINSTTKRTTTTRRPTTTTTRPVTTVPTKKDCPKASLPQLESGYFFPRTPGGTWKLKECPNEWQGTASWFCRLDGKWQGPVPDLSDCTNVDFGSAIDQVENANNVSEVLVNLTTTISSSNGGLAGGDLSGLSDLLALAGERQEQVLAAAPDDQKLTIATQYIQSVSKLSGTALKNPSTWEGAEEQVKLYAASEVQIQLEKASATLVDYLEPGKEISIKEESHDLVVRKFLREDIGRRLDVSNALTFMYNGTVISLDPQWVLSSLADTENFTKVSFFGFRDMHRILKSKRASESSPYRVQGVNTQVVGAKLTSDLMSGNTSQSSELAVNMVFPILKYFNVSAENNVISCSYWDNNLTDWSAEGCNTTFLVDEGTVMCSCTHLTNFAVLMDVADMIPEALERLLTWITNIGCGISIGCLLLTTLAYTFVKNITENHWTRVMNVNLCISLMTAQLLLVFGLDATSNQRTCKIIAVFMHYTFLVSGAWMLMKGINLYMMTTRIYRPTKRQKLSMALSCYAFPAIIIGITYAATLGNAYGNEQYCWLNEFSMMGFIVPITCIVCVNYVVLIHTVRIAWKKMIKEKNDGHQSYYLSSTAQVSQFSSGTSQRTNKKVDPPPAISPKRRIKFAAATFALASFLGISWIFGVIFVLSPSATTAILFAIFGSFQGFFIFATNIFGLETPRRALMNVMQVQDMRLGFSEETKAKFGVSSKSRSRATDSTANLQSSSGAQKVEALDEQPGTRGQLKIMQQDSQCRTFSPIIYLINSKHESLCSEQSQAKVHIDNPDPNVSSQGFDKSICSSTHEQCVHGQGIPSYQPPGPQMLPLLDQAAVLVSQKTHLM
ncbi:unnamed protein product [Notodromas monacha]|uniref:Uncharacterized protein n=1 Tax=Notodromas monacha TaxID=399045 RepID=A0A7R9BKE2_9CRUS|nr:unnamed protein product [Notodromas monacha]CAG0916268.1 unnamed protein product [Notodromas monacha]